MGFLDEIETDTTLQKTLDAVTKLEEEEARKLLVRFKEVRSELRDRLDTFAGDTFSAQQSRGVLLQIDLAIAEINRSLKTGIEQAGEALAVRGTEDLVKEIERFDRRFTGAVTPINISAVLVGIDTRNFLINRFQASIDAYAQDLRQQLSLQITNQALQEIPFDTMLRNLSMFFTGEEWKLRRLARTELHNLYNVGKLRGMQEIRDRTLPDLKKTLIHRIDLRTGGDSKAMAGGITEWEIIKGDRVVDIGKPFRFTLRSPSGRTVKRVFMAPPDRPNDRSILVPFREAWNR